MPTPHRTSLTEIVDTARALLEAEGLGGVTMQAIAQRVGVRAPSLYKRVRDRDELIRLVAEATLADLAERLRAATSLKQLADGFRAFGHEHPAGFLLVMAPGAGVPVARADVGAAASEPVLRLAGALAGAENALAGARTLTAWAAGFVVMEINGVFRLGGDVEDAWNFGIAHIAAALAAGPHAKLGTEARDDT